MVDKQAAEFMKYVQALDAKISAVAAYVAAMPGASEIDVAQVKQILGSGTWTPNSPFKAPSAPSMASTVISGIAAAAKKK